MLDVMVSSWLLHLFYESLTYITISDTQIWNKAKNWRDGRSESRSLCHKRAVKYQKSESSEYFMEICHGLVGSPSDTPGQASIAVPPQENSMVQPVIYMQKENNTNSNCLLCSQKILCTFSPWNPIYIKPRDSLS